MMDISSLALAADPSKGPAGEGVALYRTKGEKARDLRGVFVRPKSGGAWTHPAQLMKM